MDGEQNSGEELRMDEAVKQLYRKLIKENFPNSREIEKPSVFLEANRRHMAHCSESGNYIQLFIKIEDRRITDISYLCSCEPTTNVVLEILCELARGITLEEADHLMAEYFYQIIGSREETIRVTVQGVMGLFRAGLRPGNIRPETEPEETQFMVD